MRCLHHLGMVSQTQVIVGAHVEDFTPVLQRDEGTLWGVDKTLLLVEPRLLDFPESAVEPGLKGGGKHSWIRTPNATE